MNNIEFVEGDVWYPLSYDFARFGDQYVVRRKQLYIDSDETGLFLTGLDESSCCVIFDCEQKDGIGCILKNFTRDSKLAYHMTDEQNRYVDKYYR